MSSSVSYVIKKGSQNSEESPDEEIVTKARNGGAIAYAALFSIVYIGVAANFLIHIQSTEETVGDGCKTLNGTDPGLSNFCSHRDSWKTCAILSLVVPGVLHLLFGFITLCVVSRDVQGNAKAMSHRRGCYKTWTMYGSVATVVNIAVFAVLFTSKAHTTVIGENYGLKTAAYIYMCVVGIEVLTIVMLVGLGLACTVCACTACLCTCCWKCFGCSSSNNEADAEEPEEVVPMKT